MADASRQLSIVLTDFGVNLDVELSELESCSLYNQGPYHVTCSIYANQEMLKLEASPILVKAWFPYSCICRICRFCLIKKILTTDKTIWKPHTQPPNTTDTPDTTCSPR